jgi:hypothetical protein
MSSRRLSALAVAAALATAARLPAQPADSVLARLRRIDSLYTQHRARFDSLGQAANASMGWVHVHEGAFSLAVGPSLVEKARTGARLATAALAMRGGAPIETRLAMRRPVIAADSLRFAFAAPAAAIVVADTGREWRMGTRTRLPAPLRATSIADALVRVAEGAALDGTDGVVSRWLAGGRVPLLDVARSEWSDVSGDLGMVASEALRRCRAGRDAACLTALDLDIPGAGSDRDRVAEWYALGDYRALLRNVWPPRSDSAATASWLRCRRIADEAACGAAVRAISVDQIPAPVGAGGRRLFLDEVLRAGGPGAYERLLGAQGSAAERLTIAAGVPLDVVARTWRARLERSRPAAAAVSPLIGIATLGWCGALFGLTVIRRGR